MGENGHVVGHTRDAWKENKIDNGKTKVTGIMWGMKLQKWRQADHLARKQMAKKIGRMETKRGSGDHKNDLRSM